MVLTKWAEKIGLLDIIAPKKKSKQKNGNLNRHQTTAPPQESKQEKQKRLKEERKRKIQAQLHAEKMAETYNQFAKKQRVSYLHKGSNTTFDAVIAAVHFDDGPKNPYYVSYIFMFEYSNIYICLLETSP